MPKNVNLFTKKKIHDNILISNPFLTLTEIQ